MDNKPQPVLIVWSDGRIERQVNMPAGTILEIADKLKRDVENAILPANIEAISPPTSEQDGRPVNYDKEET